MSGRPATATRMALATCFCVAALTAALAPSWVPSWAATGGEQPGPVILFQASTVPSYPTRMRHYRVLAPLVRDGKLLVPLCDLMTHLGATCSPPDASGAITLRRSGHEITVRVGSSRLTIDGRDNRQPLDVVPENDRGQIFVPLRSLVEAVSPTASVSWDRATNTVHIIAGPLSPSTIPPSPGGSPSVTPPPTKPPTPRPPSTPIPTPRIVCCSCSGGSCPPPQPPAVTAPPIVAISFSPAWQLIVVLARVLAALFLLLPLAVFLFILVVPQDDSKPKDQDPPEEGIAYVRALRDLVKAVPWTKLLQFLIASLGIVGALFHAFPLFRNPADAYPVFDAVTAAWLLALVLAYYLPSLSEFSFGGFKAVIRSAAKQTVENDVIAYQAITVADKRSAAALPSIATQPTDGLRFIVAEPGAARPGPPYVDAVIREYLRKLHVKWITFERPDGTFVGFVPAANLEAWISQNGPDVSSLIAEHRLGELPGYLDARDSLRVSDTRRTALAKFRRKDVPTLAVVDAAGKFVGTLDRVQLIEDLLLPLLGPPNAE